MDELNSIDKIKLFNELKEFACGTILGALSSVYKSKKFGPKYLVGDLYIPIILPVLEEYFNNCINTIYSDEYLSEVFSKFHNNTIKYHDIDLLQIIVAMTINTIKSLKINPCDDYEKLMNTIKEDCYNILNLNNKEALLGCTNPECENIQLTGDKIFSFARKVLVKDNNSLKFSTLL
jgi:hypothetical protein